MSVPTYSRFVLSPLVSIPCAANSSAPSSKGTDSRIHLNCYLAAFAISQACPSNAKPVTSVAPFTPNSRIASAAYWPGVNIVSTDFDATASLVFPNLIPVEITPVPIGFVKMITSPTLSSGICRNLARIDYSCYRITKHDLLIVDAVPTDQGYAVFVQSLQTTAHDFAENCRVDTLLWKTSNRHGR